MTGLQALTGECCISGLNTKDAGEQWETFGSFEQNAVFQHLPVMP